MTKDKITARERRLAQAQQFNLLNNAFLSVALRERDACQYVLRVLTGIQKLTVRQVRTQYRLAKVSSHDAVLDILAQDNDGQLYNVEIQRSESPDHARRVRFYGAMIDSEYLEKGEQYNRLPEVYLIYISETDLWRKGKTVYWLDKELRGTQSPYDDGQHTLYVNAAVDDGSPVAALMRYFKTADPGDMRYGALSKRVHHLKREQGGQLEMKNVQDEIFMEGKEEGLEEGKEKERAEILRSIVKNLGVTADKAMQLMGLSETEKQKLAGKL